MPETQSELQTSFSTADTDGPLSVNFSGETLSITFTYFKGLARTVVFHQTREFSWTDWQLAPANTKWDSIYEVTGSALLSTYTGFAAEGRPFRHFRLGFNAQGKFLDVIATEMELQKN